MWDIGYLYRILRWKFINKLRLKAGEGIHVIQWNGLVGKNYIGT